MRECGKWEWGMGNARIRNNAVGKGGLPPLKLSCIQLTVRFLGELNLLLVEAGARGMGLHSENRIDFRLPPSSQLRSTAHSQFPIPHLSIHN
jgi:hypothetical protein